MIPVSSASDPMEIIPNSNFKDARNVPAKFNRFDPRSDNFDETEVIVNLTECARIGPPAVMWCAVYLLLARRRGSSCALIAPSDGSVATYLKGTGLFSVLQEEGISLEQDQGASPDSSALLPLTRFTSTTEAEDLTNQIHFSLSGSRQGSASIYHVIYETFSELANNAAEHSASPIGAYGLALFDPPESSGRLVCGVADGGIGVRTSLLRNPLHADHGHYEWSAMERATEELVSGSLDPYRGIGLYETVEKSRIPGRELVIHSGNGIIVKGRKLSTRISGANLFPGTMVSISIPV